MQPLPSMGNLFSVFLGNYISVRTHSSEVCHLYGLGLKGPTINEHWSKSCLYCYRSCRHFIHTKNTSQKSKATSRRLHLRPLQKKRIIYQSYYWSMAGQGFKKIYCESCHQVWLKSNPYHKKQYRTSGGGCFSVVIMVGVIPCSIYLAVKYLF